jgi:hypothetical protein
MCGKDSAVSTFNPSKLDNDIYLRQAYGKGFPGGWEYGPNISVLGDDEYTPKIKERSLDLIKLLLEEEIITSDEVMKTLELGIQILALGIFFTYKEISESLMEQLDEERQNQRKLEKNLFLESKASYQSKYYDVKQKHEKVLEEQKTREKIDKILYWMSANLESTFIVQND